MPALRKLVLGVARVAYGAGPKKVENAVAFQGRHRTLPQLEGLVRFFDRLPQSHKDLPDCVNDYDTAIMHNTLTS